MSLTLSVLVASVREQLPHIPADLDVSEIVRTARTVKGAVWLVKRAIGPAAPSDETVAGRWQTALACLGRIAEAGDERAQAMLDAYLAHPDTVIDLDD